MKRERPKDLEKDNDMNIRETPLITKRFPLSKMIKDIDLLKYQISRERSG